MIENNETLFAYDSDEALKRNALDVYTVKFVFNLNCLFFENIVISASGLLTNRIFFEFLIKETSQMEYLYKKRNNQSILRPILMGENKSLKSVADNIVKQNVIHYLGKDNLLHHAEWIDALEPNYVWLEEETFRNYYLENMINLAIFINENGYENDGYLDIPIRAGSLKNLIKWLDNKIGKDYLYESDIIRHVEENEYEKDLKNNLCLIASVLYNESIASPLSLSISTPSNLANLLQINRSLKLKELTNHILLTEDAIQTKEFYTSLPLKEIAELNLKDVILLREEKPFIRLRKMINNLRIGKNVKLDELQNLLNESTDILIKYSKEELPTEQKERIIREINRKEKIEKWSLFYDISKTIVAPVLLNILFPGKPVFDSYRHKKTMKLS